MKAEQSTYYALEEASLLLRRAYDAFNARKIDEALACMHDDVDWPNGMEGGIEHGKEAIRTYWLRQWSVVNPTVNITSVSALPDGRVRATVHQVVRGLRGELLLDRSVYHLYAFKNTLVKSMEILEE